MADFLEERLNDLIRYGSSWQDDYAVNVAAYIQRAGIPLAGASVPGAQV